MHPPEPLPKGADTMDALRLIENYREAYAGKSHYIDSQMELIKRTLQDACRNAEKGDINFAQANLFLARSLTTRLLESIPNPDSIRKIFIDIYQAIEDDI